MTPHALLTELAPLCTLELATLALPLPAMGGACEAAVVSAGVPTAILSCFSLELCCGVVLDTTPASQTHWRQATPPPRDAEISRLPSASVSIKTHASASRAQVVTPLAAEQCLALPCGARVRLRCSDTVAGVTGDELTFTLDDVAPG